MLNNFFRINLPYGIVKNDTDEWMAFNREYMPLGYNDTIHKGTIDSFWLFRSYGASLFGSNGATFRDYNNR